MAYLRATTIENNGSSEPIDYSHTITVAIKSGATTYDSTVVLNGFAVICNGQNNYTYGNNTRNWAEVGEGNILDSYTYNSNVILGYDTSTHQFYATNNTSANLYLHVWKIN